MKTKISPKAGPQKLTRPGQPGLAYVYTESAGEGKKLPLVVFCGGYRSDMEGTKAIFLEDQCRARGQAYVRFDYSGHGVSEGQFEDGTIGQWTQDALDILNHVMSRNGSPEGPAVLVGSSMGGWIALLMGLRWQGVLKGLIGIAAAPDFSEEIYGRLSPAKQRTLDETGVVSEPNHYSDVPYVFTKKLYEEAKKHILLNDKHPITFPMRLIQGMRDKDVPWEMAVKIQKAFTGSDVDVVIVEDGEHRLSRPEDLELIDREIRGICGISD